MFAGDKDEPSKSKDANHEQKISEGLRRSVTKIRSVRVTKEVKNIQFNCCRLFSINLQRFCPSKCVKLCCSQTNRRDRMFLQRIKEFRGEIHISHILKTLRVLKGLARYGLTKKEWQDAFTKYSTKPF